MKKGEIQVIISMIMLSRSSESILNQADILVIFVMTRLRRKFHLNSYKLFLDL